MKIFVATDRRSILMETLFSRVLRLWKESWKNIRKSVDLELPDHIRDAHDQICVCVFLGRVFFSKAEKLSHMQSQHTRKRVQYDNKRWDFLALFLKTK